MSVTTSSEKASFLAAPAEANALVPVGEATSFITPLTLTTGFVSSTEIIRYRSVAVIHRLVTNIVWDTTENAGSGGWVSWQTESVDPGGLSYPSGHGVYGVDTSDYRIQGISYTE